MKSVTHKFIQNFRLPKHLFHTSKQNIHDINFGGVTLPQGTIYLDSAASTPLDLRVFEQMQPWMLGYFANAANRLHPMGELTEHALADARLTLAKILHVSFEEIIFTSSATESNNLLLRGLLENPFRKRNKIVFCATEHSSIISTAMALFENFNRTLGIEISSLPVDVNGQILLTEAEKIIDKNTLCVCVMDVNNETGIFQTKLQKIKELTHQAGALLHVDAVQGFARSEKIACGVDYDTATISSSKIYGPKGAAALIVKKRQPHIRIEPQLTGGGHEFNLRSSTPNVAAIAGFAHACQLQQNELTERLTHYAQMEEAFCDEIKKHIEVNFYGRGTSVVSSRGLTAGSSVTCLDPALKPRDDRNEVSGEFTAFSPGILTLYFPGVNAMKLLENTQTVCASVGSACQTLQATASHVLVAMGVELENTLASFRVSFGLTNSEEEVREAARRLSVSAQKLKENSAGWI